MSDNEWRWLGPNGFEYTGSVEKLRHGLGSGELPGSTMVWRAGLSGWVPAASLPELGVAAAPAPFAPEDDAPTLLDNPVPEQPPAMATPWAAVPPAAVGSAGPAYAPVAASVPPKKKSLGWVFALAGAVGGAVVLAGIGGFGAWAGAQAKAIPDPLASGAASGSASAPVATAPAARLSCTAGEAKQIAKPIVGKIGLEAEAFGEDGVAIAFASSKNEARMIVLGVRGLDQRSEQRQPSEAPLVAVAPTVKDGALGFELGVESEQGAARSFAGVTVVAGPEGLSREQDGKLETLWAGGKGDVTVPRVASSPEAGHLVVVRRGGQSGRLEAGWLGADGQKKTELGSPKVEASALGTPAVAIGAHGALLLAAARSDAKAPWQIHAGAAKPGELPAALALLPLGEAAVSRISPAATAFLDRRWLVQWTEGPDDAHLVRVQVLDAELAPVSEPALVSPKGRDAGQGLIFAHGARAVSFFLVSTDDGHELWAASLECK